VDHPSLALADQRAGERRRAIGAVAFGIDEVRNHLHGPADAELARRHLGQVSRHRRDAVALLDAPPGDRQVRAVLADDRDVRSVQRRDDLEPDAVAVAHLPGEDRRDCVRQRVVHVEEVEVRVPGDLRHFRRESQSVGGRDEERVGRRDDLVEINALPRKGEPGRKVVGDEVDLVAAVGERETELRRHDPAAAVGRIAGDADLHQKPGSNPS
jgi:hypothetical protein